MTIVREQQDLAWISESESGILVDFTHGRMSDKHYDVSIYKDGEFYVVKGEQAKYDFFLDKEDDSDIVDTIIEAHVTLPKPSWLNFFKPSKYVQYWCEKKKRAYKKYTSNNITIIEKN